MARRRPEATTTTTLHPQQPDPKPLRPLSPREEAFVREYVKEPYPAANAAIRAGYAESGARQQATLLLRRPNVRAAIQRLQAVAVERVAATAADVLAVLWREANGKGPDTTSAARVRAAELLGKHLGLWDGLAGRPASPSTVVNVLTLTAGDVEMARQLISGHAPDNVVTLTTLSGEPSHAIPDGIPTQPPPSEPVALPTLADCARGEGGEGVGPARIFLTSGDQPSGLDGPSHNFSKSGGPPLADPPVEESRPVDPVVPAHVVEQLDGPRLFEPENA